MIEPNNSNDRVIKYLEELYSLAEFQVLSAIMLWIYVYQSEHETNCTLKARLFGNFSHTSLVAHIISLMRSNNTWRFILLINLILLSLQSQRSIRVIRPQILNIAWIITSYAKDFLNEPLLFATKYQKRYISARLWADFGLWYRNQWKKCPTDSLLKDMQCF